MHHRVAVVGTGFSGLGTAIALKKAGIEDFVVLERAGDLGGTWRDNSYPGCACDVPSRLYSFSFAQNPEWSESFSSQAEIWAYLRRCAESYDVVDNIRFNHEVTDLRWDDEASRWHITTASGELTADAVVLGVGALSDPSMPAMAGLEDFEGTIFHSARWDHGHDFAGRTVAVVGTGASAIQFVPQIQPQVGKLLLFQRTPPWIMPRRNRVFGRAERFLYRHLPIARQLARAAIYWGHEVFVLGFTRSRRMMRLGQRASLAHLRRQVPDAGLRAALTPDYTLGCKRVLLSDDYYPALTRPNVEVVTEPIAEVRPKGILTADGVEHPVDTIIFGTGFHVTDFPAAAHIRGRNGRLLSDAWSNGMTAYLGTSVAGFPNLFIMTGPNTGLGHSSMVFMIESQIAYLIDALRQMERHHLATVEVRPEVQAGFNDELEDRLGHSVWNTGGCRSWYLDVNGRNTTLWPGFTFEFRHRTRRFDLGSYELTPADGGRGTAGGTLAGASPVRTTAVRP
ncbi:MAG TPA: NAD(P)/FAD-dependent oxidoreductase [Acidimicrobiales bacterium]|nr:NAD(P)/FAD-dependent oxidoreductase [Acidimicrobiales bacterium]